MVCQTNNLNTDVAVIATNTGIKWTKTADGANWETNNGADCNNSPRKARFSWKCNVIGLFPAFVLVLYLGWKSPPPSY